MKKKNLTVVVFPGPDGMYPWVEADEVRSRINGQKEDYNEEFAIQNTPVEYRKIPFIESSLKGNKSPIDLLFWNPMPQQEIKKLLRYDLNMLAEKGISLSSVNHSYDLKKETMNGASTYYEELFDKYFTGRKK